MWRGLSTAALLAVAAIVGVNLPSDGSGRTVEAAGGVCTGTDCGAGGELHMMTPIRVLDTRRADLDVAPFGAKVTDANTSGAAANVFEVQVTGKGNVPVNSDGDGDGFDDNVLAVAVTITVVSPTGDGYLRAFGAGAPENTVSMINFAPGQVVPNSAILRPGAGGKLSIRLVTPAGRGASHVLVDLFGWVSTSSYDGPSEGARLEPAGPGRLFDSRDSNAPLGPSGQRTIPIRGASAVTPAVPNTADVVGALVNIGGINNLPASTTTYLSALPQGVAAGTEPSTSTGNLVRGQIRSTLAIVPVNPADGTITVYNHAGQTHLTVDLMGYLIKNRDPATRRGRIVPLVSPFRALDTRSPDFFAQPLPPANAEDWSFQAFVNDVKVAGEPVGNQIGLIGNIVGAKLSRIYPWAPVSSYMTVYPSGIEKPLISNFVMNDTEIMPNMALFSFVGSAKPYEVRVYNRDGYLDYLLDVSAVILGD